MSKDILIYQQKRIKMGVKGYYISYDSSTGELEIVEVTDILQLYDKSTGKIRYFGKNGGYKYLWMVETNAVVNYDQSLYATYIDFDEFKKWVESPFKYSEFQDPYLYKRFLDLYEKCFNYNPIMFEDV